MRRSGLSPFKMSAPRLRALFKSAGRRFRQRWSGCRGSKLNSIDNTGPAGLGRRLFVASDARVVVGGGFSALSYLAQLSAEERSALTWIRGPEGLSAIGSGAIRGL